MASVTIDNVGKYYGLVEALKGVSMDIADGEFVVLVGPSGCGKSTLLRMLAGLEEISSGEVRIADRVVNDLQPKDRDIAMVFQNYALYPHMTVAQNMSFSLKLKGVSVEERERRVEQAADILGLTPLLQRQPKQLSGGQRQRVAMGRAIVRNPQVFLFDEPLSNLDAKLRVQVRSEIKELHQRLRTTTIYVTHDQIEAMTMADKIVVMRDGVIEQVGAPLELYDQPVNTFVASFIGSPAMNLLNGTVTPAGFDIGGGIVLPCPDLEGVATYGVRPEHIQLDAAGLPAEIVVVEPTGAETQVVLRLGGQTLTAAFRERISKGPGEVLHIRPDSTALHLFDDAGHRLN